MRRLLALSFLLALSGAAFGQTPWTAKQTCLQTDENPPVYDSLFDSVYRKAAKTWAQACAQVEGEAANDPHLAGAIGRAYQADGQRERAIPFLRIAGLAGDASALLDIFEFHKSWQRGDLNRTQIVPRAEAASALRRAAELGNAEAILALAVRLMRGEIVRRDPDDALMWMQKLLVNLPREAGTADVREWIARLQSQSQNEDQRRQGRGSLELLARTRGDAKADLAAMIRTEDPARARTLLEEALKTYPGHAAPQLADMLVKGEGGPADPKRAISILKANSDVPDVNGALGAIVLEGKAVPRDLQDAARLLFIGSTFDRGYEAMLTALLADFPETRLARPDQYLYSAWEAADEGEPGAREGLVRLKLSSNAQFRDVAGACALAAAWQSARPRECDDAGTRH